MATLEKIRSKSVLIFVIIIAALLAFILGDFLTSGRTYFGHPTTVAKAGGVTVEYQDYQNRISQADEQLRNQNREISNDVLSQNVLQGLLTEQLLNKEYEDLGITVTDSELTAAMTGDMPHPVAQQMIYYLAQQLQLPEVSGAVLFDAMQNPAKYGLRPEASTELRSIWAQQEKEVEATMKQQKLMNLINGLYTYNKVDAKAFYDDNATTRTISYVNKDVAGIADDAVEFSDADVQALWNAEKESFRLPEETREISYIYVPIEPSQADRVAGQQEIESAVVALNSTPGTEGVASNSRFGVQSQRVTRSQVNDRDLRDFLAGAKVDSASVINRNGDTYTIAKLLGVSQGIDSINVSVLQAAPTANLDSVLTLIRGGETFAAVSDGVTVQGQDSIWASLEAPGMDAKLKNVLADAAVGSAFIYSDTIQGTPVSAIYQVNRRKPAVNFYDVAVIDYTIDPSQETLNKLSGDLRTYVSNNSSADEFTKNATDAGYSVLTAQVSNSTPAVGQARDSRRFVKWAMEARKGQVSPMLQDNSQSYMMAVAVNDIYDDYLPYTSSAVNTGLTARALNSKKADKLMADYQGKATDLNGYAEVMGAEVAEGNVNITTPALLNIGINESALQGAIAAAQKGALVGPVKGNRGVLVFQITDINTDNRPFNEAEYGERFNSTFGLGRNPSTLRLFLGDEKIDNRSLNFIQGIGE